MSFLFAAKHRVVVSSSSTDSNGESVSCQCLNINFPVSSLMELQNEGDMEVTYDNISSLLIRPKLVNAKLLALAAGDHHGACATFMHLLESKQTYNYELFSCFNCKSLTHAVCITKPDVVLVNFGQLLNKSQQESVRANDINYCQLYGIVVYPSSSNTNMQYSTSTLSTPRSTSVMEFVHDVKDRAIDYLEEEKMKMREKLKAYEKTQLAVYQELERSVLSARDCLEGQICGILNNSEDDLLEEVDSAFERSVEELSPHMVTVPKPRSSSIVDDMFELDPFADEGGEDVLSDDDDTPNYLNRGAYKGDAETVDDLAKSVPIPIMSQLMFNKDAKEEKTPEPEKMQASMMRLAQSVGGDGTEMFGDLPRPRFNTGMGYSRPHH